MENQQLIKKDRSANSYSKIFPWTFTDLVLDRVTKESLDNILVRNNFIALPYVGSKAATRLQVPMKNRRRGIWLSYIDYAGTLTVEYYNDNNLDDNHWQDSSYWLPYNTAEFQPASVGLSALAQEVFDWINSQITTAVKLNPEDLQKNSSGQIEEANRAYDTSTFSGLGYRILRKNIQSNKNILTQSMINMPNTIYEIRYDFDLNEKSISIPENSILKFNGGSLNNGIITGYTDYIKSNVLGFKTGFGAAIKNSKLLINYINIGLKIELTDIYYFSGTNLPAITNNINIKGGGIIINDSDIFKIGKNDIDIKLSEITFDTTLQKTLDSRNRVFVTPESVDDPIHINSLSVKNCNITNVRLYTQTITDFSKDMGTTAGIDNVSFIGCTIRDCGVSVCYLDDIYVGNFIIRNNNIINVGIRVFSRGSDNTNSFAPTCKSCIYDGNLAENNKIITTDSTTDFYITPLLLEDFESITISNNTYKNLIIDSDRFHSYSYYIYGRNMYIHGNTMLNVFNLNTSETLNEVFKMKGGLNRYVNDNTYTIDVDLLKTLYPSTFESYDFSALRINFMEVGASQECGDYIVRNNVVIVPGILFNSVPTGGVPLTGDVFFENNTIEALTMQGAFLALTTDVARTLYFRNNFIKQIGPSYTAFALLRFMYTGAFNVEVSGNTLYNITFIRDTNSVNSCTLNAYNNILYNTGRSLSSTSFTLPNTSVFRDNRLIYDSPSGSITGDFSAANTIDFKSKIESIFGGFVVLGNLNRDVLVECLGKRGAIYHNCRFVITKVTNNQFTIYNSDMDITTYDITVNQDIIPYREPYGLITSPILTLRVVDGNIRLMFGTIRDSEFRILKDGNTLRSYVYDSSFNATDKTISEFSSMNTYKPTRIYSAADSNNYYYDSNGRWRNYNGTLVSRERIVSSTSQITLPNIIYKIISDIDLGDTTLTMPANCTLDFQGGSFTNGTIVGSNTKINSNKIAFKSTVKLSGTFTGDLRTSWFEIDSSDCTDTLDSIFNVSQNCNVIIDEGVYNVSTKNLPRESLTTQYSIFVLKSNSNIVLNGTIKLLPNDLTNYQIFRLYNISNVIISGNGSIIGDVETHTGTTGEWGHGISISSSKHITIRDISISKCWGDGITVASYSEDNLSKDITIDNIVSTYNRRLGVSLISGDGIKFINSTTEGNGTINGTAPKMGLDIEPNPNETLNHILVDNCLIKDKGTCYIPSTASIEDIDYKIIIQNCNIPSQFNISGPCTFKGNRVRFAYISNVRYAEIQDNHIYENLIFAGTDSTPITNTKVVGNNITPLNNAAHNAAIVFDGSAVTLDKVTFVNNTIDLTKKSNIALQKGSPVNGRLNIENCVILGNKAEQQVYWTAGNIINSLIDSDCINIFNANSVEGSEVNFIGNTIIYYRENPFVIRDNITVNYDINIINNNIIPIGYTATDLINYVSHTFAGTIKSLGNNFLGKDPSTVGTYANKPTLTSNQIGRMYYMTDNSIPTFWNGEAWRDANGYPALKKKGTTAERPAIPSGNYSGYTYYDTTLNKYVLWNGTAWTNVDGTNLT